MRAWLFQDHRQKQKLGDDCPWSVGWLEPDGKRKSKTLGPKSKAERYQRKIEGELAAGTYVSESRYSWADFRKEYETKVLALKSPGTREAAKHAFNHFERIGDPKRMRAVSTRTIDDYISKRSAETYGKDGTAIAPATVNKELRTLRAALRKANKWGMLPKVPDIEFLREAGRMPTYVSPEHFALIYAKGCKASKFPTGLKCSTECWWQGLLLMAYMTGWRIGSLMSLRWEHVDLETGTALSLAKNNKGKRDISISLHPLVVEHLRKLKGFDPMVFPWRNSRRTLFKTFEDIQAAAELKLPATIDHYGFHDLRRAFATMNASRITPDALQALMQHKDYQTTQRYIAIARQLQPAVHDLFVPELKVAATG